MSSATHAVYKFLLTERPEYQLSVSKYPSQTSNPITTFNSMALNTTILHNQCGITQPKMGIHYRYEILEPATVQDRDYYIWKYRNIFGADNMVNTILPEKLVMFDSLAAAGHDGACLDDFAYLFMWFSPSLKAEGRPCRKMIISTQQFAQAKTTLIFQAKKEGPLKDLMARDDVVFSAVCLYHKETGDQAAANAILRAERAKYAGDAPVGRYPQNVSFARNRKRDRSDE